MTEAAAESTAVSRTGSTTLVKTVTETYDYVYNGGRLSQVKKTTSTTTSSGTTNATDTLDFTYDANGTPMSVKYNGTMYYFVTNLQGDVTAILNTSGTAVASYTYDAWGNILTTGGSMASTLGTLNPLRYRGYVYDTETGLYYLQSRYYNPIIGRFLNEDAFASTGQGLLGNNMFAYCGNNPVNYLDGSGTRMVSILDADGSGGGSRSLPRTGEPNSSDTIYNPDGTPKQKRWYGPDGEPVRDRDYNHAGDTPFPHDHVWENGLRGKDHQEPSPDYLFSWDSMLGIGVVTICVIGVVVIAVDDASGIGVADDYLLAPLIAFLKEGASMIFKFK